MSDKELAVQLASAALQAMAQMNTVYKKPLSGKDIENILNDCYSAVKALDSCDKGI